MIQSFFQKKWKEIQEWFNGTAWKPMDSLFHQKSSGEAICQILCVDDDISFCLFIKKLASSFGIQTDIVHSIQEAKKAIEAQPAYQSFIIDGHLPDGSGFELVAWIREKKDILLPIVFISRIYQDATSFRLLRESLHVNFILEKPIQPAEMHQLFVQLCKLMAINTCTKELFSDALLLDLKITYQKTIPDKIERLEKMILNVQRHPNLENVQTLKTEVHKIAGSAGSYGFIAVSEVCKTLETELAKQIETIKQGQVNQGWFESLDEFFTQIKIHFQMKIPDFEFHNLRAGFLPTIYVVDEDEQFLKKFNDSIHDMDFEVLTEARPTFAIQTLLSADFYPEILLLNACYHNRSFTGYELIKAFYQNNDELTSVIALMLDGDALENQVEALKKGMQVILTKPFSSSLFIPFLEQIPFHALPLPYKVLVIDDDADICQYILKTLKFADLDVKALHQIDDLEKVIKGDNPDLILLDINLCDQSGVKILHRLKDWSYQNLLVGMITLTQEDAHLLQQCYDENIDDLLFKPLERGFLQRKIAHLLKKKGQENLSVKEDEQMKWVHSQTLKRYLNQLEKQPQVIFTKMLVIFEVAGLSDVVSKVKKNVMEHISDLFDDLLKKYEIATHLGQEQFALVFQGYDPHFVQLFMRHFLECMHIELQHNFVETPFRLHEALLVLSSGDNAKHVLQRAEELLHLARQSVNQSLVLMTDPSLPITKEVFLLTDEDESLTFLEDLFKEKGFRVNVSTNYEEIQRSGGQLPLLILKGSFADIKGVHLLKNLMSQYQIQIPILHLPYLPDRNYVQRLLDEVRYFDAPFCLAIFLTEPVS